MHTEIDVRTDHRGHLPGTLGWLSERIERGNIVFDLTKKDKPAAFLRFVEESKAPAYGPPATQPKEISWTLAVWDYWDAGLAEAAARKAFDWSNIDSCYQLGPATLTKAARVLFDELCAKGARVLTEEMERKA